MQKHPLAVLLGAATMLLPIPAIAVADLPATIKIEPIEKPEAPCKFNRPEWRDAQIIEGVNIEESRACLPDNPLTVAAMVKGTNNISMETLMDTALAADAIIKKNDIDGDGDPDVIIIKLEVIELNGHSPDFSGVVPTFDIAPGVQPGMWVFAPKSRGMSTKNFVSLEANPLLRAPSPVIRVEQGDIIWLQIENGHYFPHTIHLHGVDHAFVDSTGEGNDGVPVTSEGLVMPGQSRTYEIKPRVAGTFMYHCHVQTHMHLAMGLVGMFVVEENKPNNWVQTFNVGAGKVRHPSKAISSEFDNEYDLHYHAMDKELHNIVQQYNDPRLIARKMNREYNIQDSSDDYYTLNGRSFPYTARESLIIVEPNQKIKVRMLNSSGEMLAVHTHGHKARITHYDGVEHNPIAQITRDVYDLAPAQRIDMVINTTDDGFNSYGEGIWIFHDHREKGITTDGMNPGGNVSALVYKSYLNENGMPKLQGVDISPYFSKEYFNRQLPVWQDADEWNSLGDAEEVDDVGPAFVVQSTDKSASSQTSSTDSNGSDVTIINFFFGLFIGLLVFLVYKYREPILNLLTPKKKEANDA